MDKQSLSLREKVRQYKNAPIIFIHIDTTGLSASDEVVRLTVLSDDVVVYDEIYNSSHEINAQALRASGLTLEEIQESNVYITDEIKKIEEMFANKLLVCINSRFTQKYLSKAGIHIPDDNLLDLTQATDLFAKGSIKSSQEALIFYGYDTDLSKNTFDRNFVFYDCACKLKVMATLLLKN